MTKMTLDEYLETSHDMTTEEEKSTWKKNYVEGTFRPISDDVLADVQARNREEDKQLGKVYQKIKKIEEEWKKEIENATWPETSKARPPKTMVEKVGVYVIEKVGGFAIRVMTRINRGLST